MNEAILGDMITYYGRDVRRIHHALKVFGFALAIADGENIKGQGRETLLTAAALHDIGIPEAERKYHSCAGGYQEKEGPPVARALMEKRGLDAGLMDRVCYLIGHHHTYTQIDGLDYQILVEADFLVNIYEGSIAAPEIAVIRRKYFKTGAGVRLLDGMFAQ